jgi:hypothetical protein
LSWESALGDVKIDGYTIVPLTNAYDLFLEGEKMKNCLAKYSDDCVANTMRLFSIRRHDKRVANLMIKPAAGSWFREACLGPCNKPVSTTVDKIAIKVAKMYGK